MLTRRKNYEQTPEIQKYSVDNIQNNSVFCNYLAYWRYLQQEPQNMDQLKKLTNYLTASTEEEDYWEDCDSAEL